MSLHEQLAELYRRVGPQVFSDPRDFRAALDDFLDEGAASADDIAVLVQAVQAGGLSSLMSAIAAGFDPVRAVDVEGGRVAQSAGTDPARSRWAVAALGYAVGALSGDVPARLAGGAMPAPDPGPAEGSADATQLAQRRSEAPWPAAPQQGSPHPMPQPPYPGQQQPAYQQPAPQQPPVQPPVHQPPVHQAGAPQPSRQQADGYGRDIEPTQVSAGQPQAWPAAGSAGGAGGGGAGWSGTSPSQGSPPGSSTPSTTGRPRRKVVILAAVLALVLIAALVAVLVFVKPFGGDDDPKSSGGDEKKSEEATAVDHDSLNERYSGLSGDVTAGADDCKETEGPAGADEVISCKVGDATTLTLATFPDITALEEYRAGELLFYYGNLYSDQGTGVFYSEKRDSGNALVYWDSTSGFQAAELVSASADIKDVQRLYTDTDPEFAIPTEIESEKLRKLVGEWIPDVDSNCARVPTLANDMREQAECTLAGVGSFRVGEMTTRAKMRAYRNEYRGYAEDNNGTVGPWNFSGGASEGTLIEYVDPGRGGDPDRAFLMWDREVNRVFVQGWGLDANAKKFKTWWETA